MFDPSKLNLDPNYKGENKKNEEKKIVNNSQDIEKLNTSSSEDNIEISKDILKDNSDEIIKKENKNIQSKIITGKEEIKDEININKKEDEYKKEEININKKEFKDKKEEINNSEINDTKIEEKINTEEKEINITKEKKIIFDINITSLTSLILISEEKNYDFFIIEPSEEAIRVSFRKDKVEKEVRYIKYPIYSEILIKVKTLTKLKIDTTHIKQEGKGLVVIQNNNYEIISKVVPSNFGEKLFIKPKKILDKKIVKKSKKTSVGQIFGFLGAAGLISLILGGGFITFIILNAHTIDDVKFFYSLGINLNDINTFITKIVNLIFSILIFIETIFLIIFLFKLLLTKKENKQKRISYGIYSILFLIITVLSATGWMIIDKKINSLPNWGEMALGNIRVYDNSKLISEYFDKNHSLLTGKQTSNIIGPITIKYDLNYFAKIEEKKGLKIENFIWNFGEKKALETLKPEIIHTFKVKGNHNVSLILKERNLKGEIINKEVTDIPDINISSIVDIKETSLNNGGKIVEFDASDLSNLGKIKWVMIEGKNMSKPWENYTFRLPKPVFKETLIGMYINKKTNELDKPDKIFVITSSSINNISGKISYTRGIVNDLKFTFKVKNIKNGFGEGYIKEFLWNIDGKEIKKIGKIDNQELSSKLIYQFKKYGENNISVKLINSDGKIKNLKLKLNISKNLKLDKELRIYNDGKIIEKVKYNKNNNEYFINDLPIPTNLKFDARFIKSDKTLYTLSKVEWDFNDDGNIDETGKVGNYKIEIEGNHTLTVYYTFSHRKIKNKTIKLKEYIYILGIKKEALLDLQIIKPNNYTPITVRFDASNSRIKNQNIVSFTWDYGDNITESRGSIVPGHRYITPGDYIIKLKVTTDKGNEYSIQKKLILIPEPQSVKISSSFKKAPVFQGIDFSSEGSNGQILSYFWEFGDGTNSTEANPTHMYKKLGEYTVSLKIDFKNKNIQKDTLKIIIINN